jgi:hypothetical protein
MTKEHRMSSLNYFIILIIQLRDDDLIYTHAQIMHGTFEGYSEC